MIEAAPVLGYDDNEISEDEWEALVAAASPHKPDSEKMARRQIEGAARAYWFEATGLRGWMRESIAQERADWKELIECIKRLGRVINRIKRKTPVDRT